MTRYDIMYDKNKTHDFYETITVDTLDEARAKAEMLRAEGHDVSIYGNFRGVPGHEHDDGIIVVRGGAPINLYFTDDQHWDIGDDWSFTVIATDDAGNEYAVTYEPPHLDWDDEDYEGFEGGRDGIEALNAYCDSCAEATDWCKPFSISAIDVWHVDDIEIDDPDCVIIRAW